MSAQVADYLERLRRMGVSEHSAQLERDLWILLHAVSPEEANGWITDKLRALDDPEFRALYLAYDAAFDWSPDDPRLPALADQARRWFTGQDQAGEQATGADPAIARLAAAFAGASSPAWIRLAELAKQPPPAGHDG